ncbi:MAG: FIST signal transduction protein [Candidatus Limnocylindrales bacterium]
MLTMAVGHSDDIDPLDAIATAIEQCRATLGDRRAQAGLLITAFRSFDPAILAAVRTAFPGVHVVGSTSAAELSSVEGFLEDSITLALFASDTADVTVGLGTGSGTDVDGACRAAALEALAATDKPPRLAVVLAEPFAADPQRTTEAITRALPEGVVVVGGGSARGDLGTTVPTYQFCDDRVVDDGVAILLFSGQIALSVAVGTGWKTLGARGTVTAARGGLLDRIDDRPASEFLKPYLDVTGPPAFGNPLAVVEAGAERSYLRAIVGSDPATGTIRVHGGVPVGSTVQLTTAGTDEILAGTRDAVARARADFPAGSSPEAALVFSCMVRKYVLGTRTKVEAEMARAEFGPAVPLAGLYCTGEIGPVTDGGPSRFLNETFVTVLLGT